MKKHLCSPVPENTPLNRLKPESQRLWSTNTSARARSISLPLLIPGQGECTGDVSMFQTQLDSIEDLRDKIYLFIDQWDDRAHPFKWTTKSVAKVMALADPLKEAA